MNGMTAIPSIPFILAKNQAYSTTSHTARPAFTASRNAF